MRSIEIDHKLANKLSIEYKWNERQRTDTFLPDNSSQRIAQFSRIDIVHGNWLRVPLIRLPR